MDPGAKPDPKNPAPGSIRPIFAFTQLVNSGSLFVSVPTLLWSSRIQDPMDPGARRNPRSEKLTPDHTQPRLTKAPMDPGAKPDPKNLAPGSLRPIFALLFSQWFIWFPLRICQRCVVELPDPSSDDGSGSQTGLQS
jgi:hypothetical protein